MLISAEKSTLWVIDVQGRMIHLEHDWQRMLDACIWLVALAKRVGVPVLASEQYPKGLGPTHDDLLALLGDAPVAGKTIFSCVAAHCFDGHAAADRPQAILCGMEAHVCVMQTAFDLRAQGRDVFVVADAITARNPRDTDLALDRMRAAGIAIVSREMVGFEWLRAAGTPAFKDFSVNFLQ